MTKLKYDLVMKTREFREKTLCSVYYKPNKPELYVTLNKRFELVSDAPNGF